VWNCFFGDWFFIDFAEEKQVGFLSLFHPTPKITFLVIFVVLQLVLANYRCLFCIVFCVIFLCSSSFWPSAFKHFIRCGNLSENTGLLSSVSREREREREKWWGERERGWLSNCACSCVRLCVSYNRGQNINAGAVK